MRNSPRGTDRSARGGHRVRCRVLPCRLPRCGCRRNRPRPASPAGRAVAGERPLLGSLGFGAASSDRTIASGAGGAAPDAGPRIRAASDRPGNGAFAPGLTSSAMVAGMSRRLTKSSTTCPADPPEGREISKGTRISVLIQALAVVEEPVFAEPLAVIGRDDHDGPVEHSATPQLVEQIADPLVEVGHAAIVTVPGEGLRRTGQSRLVHVQPDIEQEHVVVVGRGSRPEPVVAPPAGGRRARGRPRS